MRCEFRLEDGTLNLDLTTRLLRRVGSRVYAAATNPYSTRQQYSAITGTSLGFRSEFILQSTTGIIPTIVQPPFLVTPIYGGEISLIKGADDAVYWNANGQMMCTVPNALITYMYPSDEWADEGNVKYTDYMRIRDETGKLLWSTGTLGDAVLRVAQVEFTSINEVKSYTSKTNRGLYIFPEESFKSGTEGQDDTSNWWSASGLQMRWTNNGRTIDMSYASYKEGDIIKYFNEGNKSIINIFEVYDGN